MYTCKNTRINTHINICISTHIHIYTSKFVHRNRTVIFSISHFLKKYQLNECHHFDLWDSYRRRLFLIVNEWAHRVKDSSFLDFTRSHYLQLFSLSTVKKSLVSSQVKNPIKSFDYLWILQSFINFLRNNIINNKRFLELFYDSRCYLCSIFMIMIL